MKERNSIEDMYLPLDPKLNFLPQNFQNVHLMGIGGVGMSALAGMLKYMGKRVTGSDSVLYEPSKGILERLSIKVYSGYGHNNLKDRPHLTIVGNVIRRENPEVEQLSKLRIPYLSMSQAIKEIFLKDKFSIVICGTHGKTTTSSLCSWALECAGYSPSFFIGGVPKNFPFHFRVEDSPYFIIEGDEYDSAFFQKRPKFLDYIPQIVILTSIEFDHADIYRDLESIKEGFRMLIRDIPKEGVLILNGEDENIREVAQEAVCKTITYGISNKNNWYFKYLGIKNNYSLFNVYKDGRLYSEVKSSLYGIHNITNITAVAALCGYLEIPDSLFKEAMESFLGVRRRQEVVGEGRGITIIDDFAHHPTEVRETIKAVSDRFRGRRIIAIFEPRSNTSRRDIFQKDYIDSFDKADIIVIPDPYRKDDIPEGERFSSELLANRLRAKGKDALYIPTAKEIFKFLKSALRAGDVVIFMSNGSFDHLPEKIGRFLS